jgi:hypothetical protein
VTTPPGWCVASRSGGPDVGDDGAGDKRRRALDDLVDRRAERVRPPLRGPGRVVLGPINLCKECVVIHHLLFFWFRKDASQADVEEVLAGMRSFATIPAVKSLSISENRDFPETSAPFTHAAVLTFDDVVGRNTYLADDLHQAVRRKAMSVLGELRTISVDTGRAAESVARDESRAPDGFSS